MCPAIRASFPTLFLSAREALALNSSALLREHLRYIELSVHVWCLMRNHVHPVITPHEVEALAFLFRRVHGRHAQYFNAKHQRTGHLWQNRFYSGILARSHLRTALRDVERNPVRAEFTD
ncbi:MAG: transposase [Bryobacterales bacterium]|nr:transposase [Bryobacterales bacterium]